MLMTGVDSHRTGVGAMRETVPREHYGRPGYLTVLNQNVVTMSSLLQDGGYRTYAVGKWHVGKEPHNLPDKRGFDRSLVQGDSGSDNWETAKRYVALTDKVYWFEDGKEAVMPKEFYSSEYYVNRAIDYLRRDEKSDKPFYTYLAFQANHLPVQAPRVFTDHYKGAFDDGWEALKNARWRRAQAMGFCFFNNVAVGAAHAMNSHKIDRVAILDFDVHHGNGTEDIFYADERVLLCSSFQHPYYPGSGADSGNSHIVPTPLPARTGSAAFRAAIESTWFPALEAFSPELIIVSAGFDAYVGDPITAMTLEKEHFAELGTWLGQAHFPAAAILEGGYSPDLPQLIDAFLTAWNH